MSIRKKALENDMSVSVHLAPLPGISLHDTAFICLGNHLKVIFLPLPNNQLAVSPQHYTPLRMISPLML